MTERQIQQLHQIRLAMRTYHSTGNMPFFFREEAKELEEAVAQALAELGASDPPVDSGRVYWLSALMEENSVDSRDALSADRQTAGELAPAERRVEDDPR